MTLPSILSDHSEDDKNGKDGSHIVDDSLRNYFDAFPSESLVRQMLSQAFVINQPMSGVGGDGYWLHAPDDNLVYLVVFDCMGHGRLASIMTRVYLSAIESVIKTKGVSDPAEILAGVHQRIYENFSKKMDLMVGSGSDIAVMKYAIKERKVWYSGAKMDLVYIEEGETNRIKAHKRQVGDHFNLDRQYETHTLDFSTSSPVGIYLFSDGATDLIGGPKVKKLGRKQLMPILEKAQQLPIPKARTHVAQILDEWAGHEERLDDLLMVHFRV